MDLLGEEIYIIYLHSFQWNILHFLIFGQWFIGIIFDGDIPTNRVLQPMSIYSYPTDLHVGILYQYHIINFIISIDTTII